MINRTKKQPSTNAPAIIENDHKDPSGAIYDVYGFVSERGSWAPSLHPGQRKAIVIRKPGKVIIAGESRDGEQGDIFILPSPPLRAEPSGINGWAFFAILSVITVACCLLLPLD